MWCSAFGVIGPYFFEDEAGRAVTVISAPYTEMLSTFLEPKLQRPGVETQTLWCQQDGAAAHTARTAMRVLNEMFPAHEEGLLNGLQDRLFSTPVTSSSGDISRARCTKRNQGQRWT